MAAGPRGRARRESELSSRQARQPVTVLLGGPSAEHDVSLVSGRAIAAALAARDHPVEAWLITLDGGWWRLPESARDGSIPATAYDDPRAFGAEGPFSPGEALSRISSEDPQPVVFLALHGPFGEDGTVQALCDAAGLVYTGPGVAASAVGMDKVLFKRLAGGLGMPVVPWKPVGAGEYAAGPDAVAERLERFAAGLPDRRVMVKPARLGSSIGMTIVHRPDDRGELDAALREAFRFDDSAVVEAYLAGSREFELSVLGNAEDLAVYGPGEIFPGREFYDYVAKYSEGVSRTTDRPEIGDPMRSSLRELARAAFLAIGASGLSRVDFLVHDGRVYLSELNTMPGFTPISLFPVLCAEGGYDFAGVCVRIVELALERAERRPDTRVTRADLP